MTVTWRRGTRNPCAREDEEPRAEIRTWAADEPRAEKLLEDTVKDAIVQSCLSAQLLGWATEAR